jgi:hypothetical protein
MHQLLRVPHSGMRQMCLEIVYLLFIFHWCIWCRWSKFEQYKIQKYQKSVTKQQVTTGAIGADEIVDKLVQLEQVFNKLILKSCRRKDFFGADRSGHYLAHLAQMHKTHLSK